MSNPKFKSFEEVMARIDQARGKSATVAVTADNEALSSSKDPTHQGTVTAKDHPDGDSTAKTRLPAGQKKNSPELNDNRIPGPDLAVSGTGNDVPGTQSGDAKDDKATSPTTPIDKIAAIDGIMSRINNLKKSASASAEKPAAAKTDGEKPAAAKTDVEKPASASPADAYTDEFHIKLSRAILNVEGGAEFAERIMQKSAGVDKARELVAAAGEQEVLMAQAEYEEELYKQAMEEELADQEQLWEEYTKNASAEDMALIEKSARLHATARRGLKPYEDESYTAGAIKAAMMDDAMAAGEEFPEEAEDLGPEEIIAVLDELVSSGQLPQEAAIQVAEQLLAEQEGDEMGGMPEMSPEEAEAMAMAEKAASVLV